MTLPRLKSIPFVFGEVAVEVSECFLTEYDEFLSNMVDEVAVVRNYEKCGRKGTEIILKPDDREDVCDDVVR